MEFSVLGALAAASRFNIPLRYYCFIWRSSQLFPSLSKVLYKNIHASQSREKPKWWKLRQFSHSGIWFNTQQAIQAALR
jgi:hypothetical protein